MSEQNTADNWRLEDSGDTLDQWKLQETEQTQVAQWQLQGGRTDEVGWQPVDYERQTPRGSWVLPFLVGLALIAVFAYGVWIGLGTLGITNLSSALSFLQTAPTPTIAAAVPTEPAAVAAALTPTTAPPTATVAPTATATPVVSPTPVLLKVEQQVVRVTNLYGVNARREPTTEGDPLQVLQQGQEFVVVDTGADGWLQIALPSAELVWITSEFVESRVESVLLDVVNQRRAALNLPPLDPSAAQPATPEESVALLATATAISQTVTGTQPITGTQAVTTTPPTTATQPTTVTEPVTATETPGLPVVPVAAVEITGTVNITAGLNARSAPATTAQPVILLNGGTVLTLTGRSADSQWLQTRLADNTVAWVFAQYIDVSSPISTLPVAIPSATTAPSTPVTTTNAITGTGQTQQPATASVNSLSGANARLTPDRNAASSTVIPYDVVLTVLGRTTNNEWLQVEYQSQSVWVLVSTVSLNRDLATLPVVTP